MSGFHDIPQGQNSWTVFPGDPRMAPHGFARNYSGAVQPVLSTMDPFSSFAAPSHSGPQSVIPTPPLEFLFRGGMRPVHNAAGVVAPAQISPHGGFAGDPREIHHYPPLRVPFQPLYPPHHLSSLLPPPHPGPPIPPVTPPGMNICSVGPPGTFFQPPALNNSPFINPPTLGTSPFTSQGPNIPLSDPTDIFLCEWLSEVSARHRDKKLVQEDRPMKEHMRRPEGADYPNLKVPEARGLLSHALGILSSLRVCQAQLMELNERGERGKEQWTAIMTQVEGWQKELVDIRDLMDRGDNVQRLSRKLATIKKKRVRVVEGVSRRRREGEEGRERSEKRAEQWLQQRRQEKLKEETERSVQSDAEGLLGGVKRKLNDMQHYLKLVTALKELREYRRETHRKAGEAPLVKEDEVFSSETARLCEGLKQRVTVYEEEEHALRVMVKEEVEERMLAESSAKERLARAEREGGEGEEEEGVGGAGVHVVDPLRPFLDYYLQAESGVDALVNIRRSWDVYLSVEGSSLPDQLPRPSPPSSSHWAEYCNTHNDL